MVAYTEFVRLSQSSDSEERGRAAHFAAVAYLSHSGPADEQAALYAALIGFLDDPSVKVRAALAYGLLHSAEAPRPIILSLLHDSAVISRAVLQYSPVLIDADLIGLVRNLDLAMLLSIAQRSKLSARLAAALVARGERQLTLRLMRRLEIGFAEALLADIASQQGRDPEMRGALLARKDLPAQVRLMLVQMITEDLRQARIVKGALAPDRLARLLRDSTDTALSAIGEREASKTHRAYAAELIVSDRINTRVLLHAVVTGHVMFFADCLAELSQTPRDKVFMLLESGSRPALSALLGRCGLKQATRGLFVQLVMHARSADLADDAAARHFVVTALTEEMITDHDGVIPPELEEAFAYLSEQNVMLARKAARGVMAAFASEAARPMALPVAAPERLALSAA
ncbi:hypothetical protein VW29_16250 [Devosia limi DSM 17137]|uniref:Uncharacterized conserved protein, DUF2336 family n=1 Tax=Devosia limi DSM 17137 TaxID=1121477 RepID=A0A0F5LJK2_9HYPH|nr:DUF2336 domain-containing protein [Devosia limi]KKB82369.1 hypothetical protein VW29_16250 [Devosia limi DSM 17137]SHE63994.1 Uncharacterized conserved protein, DUF2336 family [Devosia limi DSM 17137]